ncbi:FTR1 family iron permease [Nitrosopumilus ureiphilus]|uniref:Iron permease n=1 Tax=Nitrosopumilus ureiphilus TaxID=1470067 RepID=A0A7D5RDK3_9ARCH|nr:FTR1 family protein [Nitrosopumilus ureiphilus]QLH06761.1 iron permease [Nitrosopumilus ureiphilus]
MILVSSSVPNLPIFAETSDVDTEVLFIKEFLSVSVSLIEQNITDGNIDNAKNISKIVSEIFPHSLSYLREYDSELTDEIHVILLDMHSQIGKTEQTILLQDISNLQDLVEDYNPQNPNIGKVVSKLLTIVDEQYQIAYIDNNDSSYSLSTILVNHSSDLFELTNYNDRLSLEVKSFLDELKWKLENKDDFVSIGTLITAINRDLNGTETVVYDKQNIYQTIHELYDELVISLNGGDYQRAEELAIEAYLENFEYLEADIEVVDSELLYKLEIDMREELRQMIKNKQDSDRIILFIEKSILPDLELAEQKVSDSDIFELTIEANAFSDKNLKEMGDASEDAKTGVRNEIDFIRDTLEVLLIQYENGDYESAYTSARTAYLDSYEFVEIPLRAIDPDFTLEVEFQFAELRNSIKQQADYEQIQELTIAIKRNLDESERIVSGTGTLAPSIAFTSSFAIIFREGLESVLILGAIVTYLEASRNTQYKKYIYYGILAAIGATAVTWVIASYIIDISGVNRELIEAIAALSATAVLFYVSFWVLNKIEHKRWMEFVKAKVWQATTTGSVMVFVMLSFFTVYREGFETVLFYQAMSGFAKYMEVYVGLGFVLGIASLLVLYFIMKKLGKKLPLRALFGLTMGVGAYLSIAFLGNAIRELQIIEIIPYTGLIGIIPRLDINLAAMTGIYPTLETIVAQIILFGIYLVASTYVLIMRPRKENQLASMRKSRGIASDT